MTDSYQSPPYGTPPERERPAPERDEPRDDQERGAAVATAREDAAPHDTPPGTPEDEADGAEKAAKPFSIDAERERLVWTPPLPQYPARPTREEPVQYQAPRPQPAPNYTPQAYVQPQGAPPPPPAASHPSMSPPSYAPAIAGGYSAPANPFGAPAQTIVSPPMPRASKARMGRRMMRRMVRGGSAIGKAVFGVRPGLVVAFILVLLLTGWFAYDKWLAGSGATSATPNAANKSGTITLPPETPAVQAYLTAVQKGDTDGVWNSLGAQEKAQRISRGDDKTVLDAVLKAQKQQGFTYTAYHYVAGYGKNGAADPTKGGIYYYVGDVGSGAQKTSVPMVFVMDNNGQISQVSDQLYDYMLQQLKGP
jgi:hypothetical protein